MAEIFKIEIQKGGPNNSAVLQNWFPQEIKIPLFNLRKFEKTEKSTAESCRMHRNLLDDKEFGSLKFSKFKYKRGDQIIQPFCRIGSHQEISYRIFNLRKFEKN